jgi:hypothetical protein
MFYTAEVHYSDGSEYEVVFAEQPSLCRNNMRVVSIARRQLSPARCELWDKHKRLSYDTQFRGQQLFKLTKQGRTAEMLNPLDAAEVPHVLAVAHF